MSEAPVLRWAMSVMPSLAEIDAMRVRARQCRDGVHPFDAMERYGVWYFRHKLELTEEEKDALRREDTARSWGRLALAVTPDGPTSYRPEWVTAASKGNSLALCPLLAWVMRQRSRLQFNLLDCTVLLWKSRSTQVWELVGSWLVSAGFYRVGRMILYLTKTIHTFDVDRTWKTAPLGIWLPDERVQVMVPPRVHQAQVTWAKIARRLGVSRGVALMISAYICTDGWLGRHERQQNPGWGMHMRDAENLHQRSYGGKVCRRKLK